MEVSSDDDVLTFAINRGLMVVYHALTRRTTAGIQCGAGNCPQRTAATTSFVRQIAKVGIQKAHVELRGGSETSLGRWMMDDEQTIEMRVRGMTTAEAVIKVLTWRPLARGRLLAVRYERQRVIR